MTALPKDRPVRIAIREIAVSAALPLEARRLSDGLPAALDRALARLDSGAPAPRRLTPADRAAEQIAQAVRQRLEAGA